MEVPPPEPLVKFCWFMERVHPVHGFAGTASSAVLQPGPGLATLPPGLAALLAAQTGAPVPLPGAAQPGAVPAVKETLILFVFPGSGTPYQLWSQTPSIWCI